MKKVIRYMSFVGLLMAGGCSGFLDGEPLTQITDENFYQTKADAEMAIVGCYDGMQQLYSSGVAFPTASEVFSDNCFGGVGNNDAYNYQVLDEFDLQRSPGEVNIFDENWKNYYKAIYRSNALLQKMDQIDWEGDETAKVETEAEARFLRAYAYFDMVRLWERVPLVLEPVNGNIPQSESDSTYKAITEDLLFAAEFGSETVSPGKVNRFVAKAYLAKVFLFYTGYYGKSDLVGLVSKEEVLTGLEEVISSGNYQLIADFKDLWPAASSYTSASGEELQTTYAGKDNAETVFAIKYNITSDYDGNTDGNHWLVMLGLRDAKSKSYSPYGKGWGACTVNPKLYNSYATNDNRRDASIIAIEEEGLDFDVSDQREYSGYTNKKYTPLANPDGTDVAEANGAVNFQIGQFQDYVVMRYADVLLMAAELGSANAQDYLDQVRGRAGLGSVAATNENILRERMWEFAFEGIRYWDLLRQGVEVAAATVNQVITLQDGGVDTEKTIKASNLIETRGLQMIPQNQITRSGGVLTQNEGWK
ncbi:RagB/SusD family nutrient uptake outer membrane protein [Limibacter armeniacum]|uniref:RagB/SusD family nutrient uptake outer membrane protein n=1 Tax=Limibacter armeniacum TaxID=466084 RepID=UPI002FE53E41